MLGVPGSLFNPPSAVSSRKDSSSPSFPSSSNVVNPRFPNLTLEGFLLGPGRGVEGRDIRKKTDLSCSGGRRRVDVEPERALGLFVSPTPTFSSRLANCCYAEFLPRDIQTKKQICYIMNKIDGK